MRPGTVKLALYDDGDGSAARGVAHEVFLGDANSMLVRIPPMIWNDVKGLGQKIVKRKTELQGKLDQVGSRAVGDKT